ncbi:MAG: hypothetical protein A3H96_00415 [Acidobacteria bacterium RIFCSPLOWO2_02_FULL_67_36]|nr:MAG: hypothetical protein A3H96_00415 [Acidobacteria bacterium RIFCSPLOWO2_02_FULL_67_36]OFW23120.1 MAG: hypothetical protein A3G21_00935 [Acidobacteria bacterium RIFCSPLOWO2_12_FULL_66_21]
MPDYITAVNQLIVDHASRMAGAVLYGENIKSGSRISGLTKNLRAPQAGRILNVGNCESTHCGVGFGLMMAGVPAILFVKQLDFMLLGIDHFVSTYNVVRSHPHLDDLGSFTIITIVCDQGWQGPQSSFNALGDLCSLARVPGYSITNAQDTRHVLERQLPSPGFRIIALSQRLFSTEFLEPPLVYAAHDSSVFQYTAGDDVTIACFNFAFPQGQILSDKLAACGITADLFSINAVVNPDWTRIVESVARTKRIVLIDDTKGARTGCDELLRSLALPVCGHDAIVVTRPADIPLGVCPDSLDIDYERLIAQLGRPNIRGRVTT